MHLVWKITLFVPQGKWRGSCVSFWLAQNSLSYYCWNLIYQLQYQLSQRGLTGGKKRKKCLCLLWISLFSGFFLVIFKIFHYFLTQNTDFFFTPLHVLFLPSIVRQRRHFPDTFPMLFWWKVLKEIIEHFLPVLHRWKTFSCAPLLQ